MKSGQRTANTEHSTFNAQRPTSNVRDARRGRRNITAAMKHYFETGEENCGKPELFAHFFVCFVYFVVSKFGVQKQFYKSMTIGTGKI
jgi:hypothetical protein